MCYFRENFNWNFQIYLIYLFVDLLYWCWGRSLSVKKLVWGRLPGDAATIPIRILCPGRICPNTLFDEIFPYLGFTLSPPRVSNGFPTVVSLRSSCHNDNKRTFFFWAGGMMWKFLNTGCLIKNSSSGETELADFFTKLDNRLLKPFS